MGRGIVKVLAVRSRRRDTWSRRELVGTVGDARKVVDPDRLLGVYRAVARGNGTEVWDAAWLKKAFGVEPKALPPDVDSWPTDPESVGDALAKAEGLE
jgi:hypothetical protein